MLYRPFITLTLLVLFNVTSGLYAQINLKKLKDKASGKLKNESTQNTNTSEDEDKPMANKNKQIAEIIFTKKFYPNFETAKPNAIQEVVDGDSLWLYVKLDKPLKNYVHTQKITQDDGGVKTLSHFQLGIGPQEDENDYQTERIWVGEHGEKIAGKDGLIPASYLEKTEFLLSLTEYKKNLCSKLFIALVGSGDAGIWKNEIRFYRGNIEAGADNPALGTGKITCNVDNGIPKYRKMWNMFNEVLEKGSAEDNVLPKKANFEDTNLKALIINDLKNHGLTFNKLYFVQGWIDYNMSTGGRLRKAQAVYTYKKEGRCFFGFAYPTQEYNGLTGTWTPIKIVYEGNGFPITCDKY